MNQQELNAHVRAWIETGNSKHMRPVLAAIKDGSVRVEWHRGSMVLRGMRNARYQALSDALTALHKTTGKTMAEIADEIGVSSSSMTRLLAGAALPSWPTVAAVVTAMGGQAEQFRGLYDEARRARLAGPTTGDIYEGRNRPTASGG